jgi:NADPH:quinone reductase-like Zn-dependent oxidoreductase
MRVVGVMTFGGPEQLQVIEVPTPEPGPGEVRIRVHGAAVNPTDIALRSGAARAAFADRPPPYVPGMDASGVVSAVGDGVSWSEGVGVIALVMPHGPHGGAYADEVVVPAESVVRRPAGIDPIPASTLLMNAMTARMALDRLDLHPGQTILVTGAPGAFGGSVVQLAKAEGLRVIVDAAPADEELVRSLGADEVVGRGDGLSERVRQVVPSGVDGAADGARLKEAILPAIRDGGAVASVREWNIDPGRGVRIHRVQVPKAARETAALDRLARQAETGVLRPRVADVFAPSDAAEAHRRFELGGVRGRFVIDFTQ